MVDRPGKNFSIILTNHGHFGLFSTSLKFERGRPRWILSDSRSTWKIQIVSKRMQNASNVSMLGRADHCTVKLQGTACIRILTYPLFLRWARGQVLLILPRIGQICFWEERDQKVSGGLGGVLPWAFRHRSLLKTSLGSTLWRNSQSCLAGPSKPPESKIAAVGSTKRLPWSHNDILRLVRGSALHPLAYCPPGSRVLCDAS